MRMLYRIMLVGCLCVVLSGLGLLTLSDPNLVKRLGGIARDLWGGKPGLPLDSGVQRSAAAVTGSASPSRLQDFTFPPFTASSFETAGFGTANRFTGPIEDRGSIEQVSAAIATRAERGINACLQELRSISQGGADKALRTVRAEGSLIFLLMYQGKFNEAALWTERAIADAGVLVFLPGSRPTCGRFSGSSTCGGARRRTAWNAWARRAVSFRSLPRPCT